MIFWSRCEQELIKRTGSDSETSVEVVDDGEDGGIELDRDPVGGDEANHGNDDDEGGVEPVDVLVPVGPGHGRVGNVHLVEVVSASAQRLVVGSAIRKGSGSLGRGRGGRRRHGE